MRVAYRGNFQPDLPEHLNGGVPWSTEAHIAGSWEQRGHEVIRIQENTADWTETVRTVLEQNVDVFLWTSTWGMAHQWDQDQAMACVRTLNEYLPTVAMHLDLFFGLGRHDQVTQEPWFRVRHVFTADGGHPDDFAAAGVNHHWMPPAIYAPEARPGKFHPRFSSDVAFVGNWRGGYHAESAHRAALVAFLQRTYAGRCRFWPMKEQIRGRDLADLYASARVVVGDSCLAGTGLERYCSDRIPETLGRRGLLLHPHVSGVTGGEIVTDGEHLLCWDAYDWSRLRVMIDNALDDPDGSEAIRQRGYDHVLAHHTYANRVDLVIDTLVAAGDLSAATV